MNENLKRTAGRAIFAGVLVAIASRNPRRFQKVAFWWATSLIALFVSFLTMTSTDTGGSNPTPLTWAIWVGIGIWFLFGVGILEALDARRQSYLQAPWSQELAQTQQSIDEVSGVPETSRGASPEHRVQAPPKYTEDHGSFIVRDYRSVDPRDL